MATVIRLIGLAVPVPTSYDGQYVVAYDPHKSPPRGELLVTPNLDAAQVFPTLLHAIDYYRQSHGQRSDGLPNRPLTAFTVEFLRVATVPEGATNGE